MSEQIPVESICTEHKWKTAYKTPPTKQPQRRSPVGADYLTVNRGIIMQIFWRWTARCSTMALLLKFFVCWRIWMSPWVFRDWFKLSTSSWIWIKKESGFCPLIAMFQTSIWFLPFWEDGGGLLHELQSISMLIWTAGFYWRNKKKILEVQGLNYKDNKPQLYHRRFVSFLWL